MTIFTPHYERLQEIRDRFFGASLLAINEKVEGTRIDDRGLPVFGLRAGRKICPTNLLHEMCHFVEINEARMCQYGWGLQVPKQHILGRIVYEPVTYQASEREIRVLALQHSVMRFLDIAVDLLELGKLLTWLPDTWAAPVKYHDIPHWGAERIEALSHEKFTFDFFQKEWNRRNAILLEKEWSEKCHGKLQA